MPPLGLWLNWRGVNPTLLIGVDLKWQNRVNLEHRYSIPVVKTAQQCPCDQHSKQGTQLVIFLCQKMLRAGEKSYDPQLKLPSFLINDDKFVKTCCLETKPTSSMSYRRRFLHSLKAAEHQFFLRCLISRIRHLDKKKKKREFSIMRIHTSPGAIRQCIYLVVGGAFVANVQTWAWVSPSFWHKKLHTKPSARPLVARPEK